jgi:hypothetical protein
MTLSRPSQQVNHSDFMGSLFYNFNAMTGFALGGPSPTDGQLYSDVVFLNGGTKDYVTGNDATVDVGGYIMSGDTTYQNIISRNEWEEGDWFLFGQHWLPMLAPPQDPNDSTKYIRRNNASYETKFNSARSDVLMPTLMTFAKLAGIGIGTWYGGKLLYKVGKKYV